MELPVSRWLLLVGIDCGTTPGGQAAPAASDADLLAGADTRIEKHRKADAAIVVVDAAGRPLSNAKIDVEQTRHAFLFGCNIFLWGSLPNETTEQARSATRIVSPPRPARFAAGRKIGASLPAAVCRLAELCHTSLLLGGLRTRTRQARPRADRTDCPLVPTARHPHERASAGLATVPMLRGFPAIRTSFTGCNWAASTIACGGSPG